jgi:hypothetical protein
VVADGGHPTASSVEKFLVTIPLLLKHRVAASAICVVFLCVVGIFVSRRIVTDPIVTMTLTSTTPPETFAQKKRTVRIMIGPIEYVDIQCISLSEWSPASDGWDVVLNSTLLTKTACAKKISEFINAFRRAGISGTLFVDATQLDSWIMKSDNISQIIARYSIDSTVVELKVQSSLLDPQLVIILVLVNTNS